MVGRQFGKLLVISQADTRNHRTHWLCQCACGNTTIVSRSNLQMNTKSCGCIRQGRKPAHGHCVDGKRTPAYKSYTSMKDRCYDKNHKSYHRYGGRGITVCNRWLTSFAAFIADMGEPLFHKAQIDRIDNDGNYEPMNCRWVTPSINSQNRCNNRVIEWNGVKKPLIEWARVTGISENAISKRLTAGWDISRALSEPVKPRHLTIEYNGESKSIAEWSRFAGIKHATLYQRLFLYNWDIDLALRTPAIHEGKAVAS